MKNLISRTFCLLLLCSCAQDNPALIGSSTDWAHYLGGYGSSQYSQLTQINTDNVAQLEVAWSYVSGDSAMFQTNHLVVDGRIYAATPYSRLVALDGTNGQELWTFDPDDIHDDLADRDQRGVAYWQDGDAGRVLTSKGPYLYMVDSGSGRLVKSFGDGGFIHLGEQLDVEGQADVYLNTPGQVYRDTYISGVNTPEDVPGAVRAFDLHTGKRKWIFHTLPRPGEFGSETWPKNYISRTGGASDWSGVAIDTSRGIVFASTETAGPDFYGGDRYGENLFANSVLALDIHDGSLLWHQQLVHHDLWDLDNPCPPTLLTVRHEGVVKDVVAQGTKMGLLFVFDRETGEPLWPIEERPMEASRLPDMKAWPTQPFPTAPPPLMRQRYTADDVSNISPRAEMITRETLGKSGNYGPYPPPGLDQVIMFPGYDGGMEWGGQAADPEGILYANVNEMPWFYQLVPTRNPDGSALPAGEKQYRIHCASCHGIDRTADPAGGFPSLVDIEERHNQIATRQFINNGAGRMPSFRKLSEKQKDQIVAFLFGEETKVESHKISSGPHEAEANTDPPYVFRGFQRWFDEEGYPAIKPPWGTLNAVDLNTGTIKWKVPLGEFPELTARGIPQTGTENYGGPVVTASGVLFIAATADAKIRAFASEDGRTLWEHDLPFDGNATPSIYSAGGRQYVIISCGNAKKKPFHGGTLMAFALPE